MKLKKVGVFAILLVCLVATTVLADTTQLSSDVEDLVKNIAETKGIAQDQIEEITEVDFNALPEQVNIETIDTTNLALYEVNISTEEKPVYIITASDTLFQETIKKFAQRVLLNFGYSGELSQTTFLNTATGVKTSLDKGYVMMRDGSLTGLSTNLEITNGEGEVEILIYKNKELIGFRNTFNVQETGTYEDYDTISENTLNFEKGDLISIEINMPSGVTVNDITTLLEISTE